MLSCYREAAEIAESNWEYHTFQFSKRKLQHPQSYKRSRSSQEGGVMVRTLHFQASDSFFFLYRPRHLVVGGLFGNGHIVLRAYTKGERCADGKKLNRTFILYKVCMRTSTRTKSVSSLLYLLHHVNNSVTLNTIRIFLFQPGRKFVLIPSALCAV